MSVNINDRLAREVVRHRAATGESLRDLAARAGINHMAICRLLDGSTADIGVDKAQAIAGAVGYRLVMKKGRK